MTRNDIRAKFNKEKDLHVLQTEGTGYIHYTDDYVHWLEDIALRQANGAEQNTSSCNIPLVNACAPNREFKGTFKTYSGFAQSNRNILQIEVAGVENYIGNTLKVGDEVNIQHWR